MRLMRNRRFLLATLVAALGVALWLVSPGLALRNAVVKQVFGAKVKGAMHGPDGKLFGTERVFDVVRANQGRTAREIVDALYGTVRTFCGDRAQPDDMTAIIIKAAPAERAV